jgi:hypothetical protein
LLPMLLRAAAVSVFWQGCCSDSGVHIEAIQVMQQDSQLAIFVSHHLPIMPMLRSRHKAVRATPVIGPLTSGSRTSLRKGVRYSRG